MSGNLFPTLHELFPTFSNIFQHCATFHHIPLNALTFELTFAHILDSTLDELIFQHSLTFHQSLQHFITLIFQHLVDSTFANIL